MSDHPCRDCRFFVKMIDVIGPRCAAACNDSEKEQFQKFGECRRHAKSANGDQRRGISFEWPQVRDQDFCGDWEARA